MQVVLLVCLNHHVRSGFGRACKSKRPGAEASRPSRRPGQPSLKAGRAPSEPAVRGPRRRCRRGGAVAEAPLPAGGCCTSGRAGEHEARRLLVCLEEAAAAHVHRARHDLRRGRRRGVTGGSKWRGADEVGVDASKRGRGRGGGPCRCTPSTSPRGRRTAGRLHPRSPAPRPRRARTGRAGTRRLCRRRAS